MPTQAKNEINFKNAICLAVRITGEPRAGCRREDGICSMPGELIPPQLCPGGLFAQRTGSSQRTLPWEGSSSARPNLLIPWKRAVLEALVWLLAGCSPCHCLARNLPELFLQQLDAAFSSSRILKPVFFPKSMEKVLVAAPDLVAGELFLHQPCGCHLPLGKPDVLWVWFLACCVCTSRAGKKHPLFLWKPLYLCAS